MIKRLALLLIFTLAACTSPVEPQDSGVPVAAGWNQLNAASKDALIAGSAEAAVDQSWWKNFSDPTLDALVNETLANSKTLQIAKARIEEARASRGVSASALFPSVDITASAQRGNQGVLSNNKAISIAEVDAQASWELDLFGRNQARLAQANAILQSEEASQQAVRVTLLADVARNYFDLRNYERQIALTRENLATENETLKLIRAQFNGAEASNFDVQRAAAQVSTTEAMIPSLQTNYDAALNRLNVLLGHPPGTKDALLKTPAPARALSSRIVIAAPARVLATRP
ncbi:MAG TPA: TolC family protein, partial [Alphaproteobacteria bacterium]|nr:TolC family protein [Alphaproteobacteria bacterium]